MLNLSAGNRDEIVGEAKVRYYEPPDVFAVAHIMRSAVGLKFFQFLLRDPDVYGL